MKFIRNTNKDTSCKYNGSVKHLPKHTIVTFVPSIVSELYVNEEVNERGVKVHTFDTDITLLFNQQRIESLGVDTIKHWLDTLQPLKDSMADLRKNITDTELIQNIKSRRLQEPSEIKVYMDYLKSQYDNQLQKLEDFKVEYTTTTTTDNGDTNE